MLVMLLRIIKVTPILMKCGKVGAKYESANVTQISGIKFNTYQTKLLIVNTIFCAFNLVLNENDEI